jgi:hypothetical protein
MDNSTVMDRNSHGRRPVVRPRIRWEENQEGLLVAAEYKTIVETNKGQRYIWTRTAEVGSA